MGIPEITVALTAACAILIGNPPSPLSHAGRFEPVVQASAQRIELAEQVALSKWFTHRPVEDAGREELVIRGAVRDGVARGLKEEFVASFFRAQIEANKSVQSALLSQWRLHGPDPRQTPPDLVRTVRPELDRIQSTLIDQLAATRDLQESPSCRTDLQHAIDAYLSGHHLPDMEATALRQALVPACALAR
jgi:chorismate mutase